MYQRDKKIDRDGNQTITHVGPEIKSNDIKPGTLTMMKETLLKYNWSANPQSATGKESPPAERWLEMGSTDAKIEIGSLENSNGSNSTLNYDTYYFDTKSVEDIGDGWYRFVAKIVKTYKNDPSHTHIVISNFRMNPEYNKCIFGESKILNRVYVNFAWDHHHKLESVNTEPASSKPEEFYPGSFLYDMKKILIKYDWSKTHDSKSSNQE